ncbi:hypothetical protein RIF29_32315 [Crotalaria pallida]|uniref:DUF4408 domain-containing protein n=1 Tax=Crotalaria pallida TaxID=3830 RepID=A0AAN9HY21_CROPI
MDSFNFTDVQAEKANVMLKHRKLRRIASLFRLVEVCVVMIFISRLPLQLPVSFKNSSEYFRDFSVFMNNPGFIFLIGNVIIITLFAQSGQFSSQGAKKNNPEPDLYQDFILKSTKNKKIQGEQKCLGKQNRGTEDRIKSGKQSMRTEDSIKSEEKSMKTEDSINHRRINGDMENNPENYRIYPRKISDYSIKKHRIEAENAKWAKKQSIKTGEAHISLEVKNYRRCETEILRHVQSEKEKPRRALRRCETENKMKSIQPSPPKEVEGISSPEDHMSNEEFRHTVEAFIAKQQRLLREEDHSLV